MEKKKARDKESKEGYGEKKASYGGERERERIDVWVGDRQAKARQASRKREKIEREDRERENLLCYNTHTHTQLNATQFLHFPKITTLLLTYLLHTKYRDRDRQRQRYR